MLGNKMNTRLMRLVITSALATHLLSGCVIGNQMARHGENASVTLGNVVVKDQQQGGHLSSVNGNVEVGSNTVIKTADTVNGNVEIGDNSQTNSLSTVNGNVYIGDNTVVDGSASTVNGSIVINKGAHVKQNVRITNGDVILKDKAKVSGNIVFEDTSYSGIFNNDADRKLDVADNAIIEGNIILYTPVKLVLPDNFDRAKIDDRSELKK